jgi:phage/plasmid-associated DNA primase
MDSKEFTGLLKITYDTDVYEDGSKSYKLKKKDQLQMSADQLFELIEGGGEFSHAHEILEGYVKPFYDIDGKNLTIKPEEHDSIISKIKVIFESIYTIPNSVVILDSSGIKDEKYCLSLHIIINNYGYVKSPRDVPKTDQYRFVEEELEKVEIQLDPDMYIAKSHNFRLIGCSKLEDINNRILKLYHAPNGVVGGLVEFSDLTLDEFRRTLVTEVLEEKEIIIEDKADKFCKEINGKKDPIEDEDKIDEVEIVIEEEEKKEEKPEVKEESEKKEYEFTYEEKLTLTRKMFDRCYDKKRFDIHEHWFAISCALKNEFNQKDFHELAVYMSEKSPRYKPKNFKKSNEEEWRKIKKVSGGYTFGTLRHYAKIDKPKEYAKIFANFFLIGLELTHKGVAKYLKEFFPDKFIWNKDKLYAFNGRFWESGKKAIILMRYCISEDLYDILWDMQITKRHEIEEKLKLAQPNEISELKAKLSGIDCSLYGKKEVGLKRTLGDAPFVKNVVDTTQQYFGNDQIEFDDKWWLRGFNNCVLDLKTHQFREYKYDDYISMTVGYDWIEPSQEEVDFLMSIYRMIQPIPENLECLLRIFSTTLEGRVLLYFIILNGRGQNGKTLMTKLMLFALGNLGMTGNNSILTEPRKTGANPELANIHQKTYVNFEEPRKDKKLQNANIRELTGGNNISARKCFSNETEMKINATFTLCCNNKPNMASDIEIADVSRILDIRFSSEFVKPARYHLVNEAKHIYKANEAFKTDDFLMKYRCAHMKICMMAYKRYSDDGFDLKIPQCFLDNTQTYLEKSSQIGEWFWERYEKTGNKEDHIKLAEVYEEFKNGLDGLYQSMSRAEQAKWRENAFKQHFIDDPFIGLDYVEKGNVYVGGKRTTANKFLIGYKKREEKKEEEGEEVKDCVSTVIKDSVSILTQSQP